MKKRHKEVNCVHENSFMRINFEFIQQKWFAVSY